MALHAIQPGEHSVARPLPEPPRTHRISKLSQSTDKLTRALAEWLADGKSPFTLRGEEPSSRTPPPRAPRGPQWPAPPGPSARPSRISRRPPRPTPRPPNLRP